MDFEIFILLCNLFKLAVPVSIKEGKNIALDSTYLQCGITNISSRIITDGIIKNQDPLILKLDCEEGYGYIDFILNRNNFVSYVVLYPDINKTHEWDYFSVHYYEVETNEWKICAASPDVATMRSVLACDGHEIASKVRLQIMANGDLSLVEFQIFSLGIDGNREMAFHGCFSEITSTKSFTVDIFSCRNKCSTNAYFAMKLEGCFCVDDTSDHEIPASECNKLCPGNSISVDIYCGSTNVYSVYRVDPIRRPFYVGCFDLPPSSLEYEVKTIQECRIFCQNSFYMWIRASMCSCGNDYEPIKEATSKPELCDMPCRENKVDICGGSNGVSIYHTCYYKFNSPACGKSFKCRVIDKTGTCTKCKDGYTGFSCVHRVDDYVGCWIKGVCTDPKSRCASKDRGFVCICLRYHKRFKENGTCEENKCSTDNPCIDKPNTVCTWEQGVFVCNCKYGYDKNIATDVCEENKCITENPCVDQPHTVCNKSNGQFVCSCMYGYEMDANNLCRGVKCILLKPCTDPNSVCKTLDVDNYECVCKEWFIDINNTCIEDICKRLQPCSKYPHEVCIQINYDYDCVCKKGYVRYEEDSPCEEDKCAIRNPCNKETEMCKTFHQTAICECISGHKKVEGKCPSNCKSDSCISTTNTKCRDIFKAFVCVCKDEDHVDLDKDGNCEENLCKTKQLCEDIANSTCEFISKTFQCVCEQGLVRVHNSCIIGYKGALESNWYSNKLYFLFIIPIILVLAIIALTIYNQYQPIKKTIDKKTNNNNLVVFVATNSSEIEWQTSVTSHPHELSSPHSQSS